MSTTYRIGEAATLLNLKTYVLRFWETEFPDIVPLRTDKGQRLYTEKHLALLKRIRFLLHDRGLTINGARKVLAEEKGHRVANNPGLSTLTDTSQTPPRLFAPGAAPADTPPPHNLHSIRPPEKECARGLDSVPGQEYPDTEYNAPCNIANHAVRKTSADDAKVHPTGQYPGKSKGHDGILSLFDVARVAFSAGQVAGAVGSDSFTDGGNTSYSDMPAVQAEAQTAPPGADKTTPAPLCSGSREFLLAIATELSNVARVLRGTENAG